jgi:nucleolar protein 12
MNQRPSSHPGDAAKKAKGDDEAEDSAPRRPVDPEREKRTVFVGNVPVAAKKPALKNMFRAYGAIESIRFRSVVR